VDALNVKLPPSEPVNEDKRDEYDVVMKNVIKQLDSISFDIKEDSLTAYTIQ
jgi:hypothetical protein